MDQGQDQEGQRHRTEFAQTSRPAGFDNGLEIDGGGMPSGVADRGLRKTRRLRLFQKGQGTTEPILQVGFLIDQRRDFSGRDGPEPRHQAPYKPHTPCDAQESKRPRGGHLHSPQDQTDKSEDPRRDRAYHQTIPKALPPHPPTCFFDQVLDLLFFAHDLSFSPRFGPFKIEGHPRKNNALPTLPTS